MDQIIQASALDDAAGAPAVSGAARVAPSTWAEALHDPAVADIVRGTWGPIRTNWIKAAQRMRDDGGLPQRGLRQLLRPEVLAPPDPPASRNEEPGAGLRASTTTPGRETRTAAAGTDTGAARQDGS